MYAIENHLGRFEAETEKQAKALLRKARKAYQAKEAADSVNYQLARLRAEAQAYRIMTTRSSTEGFPRGWRLKPIDGNAYCVQSVYVDYRTEWRVDTGNEQAQSHFHGAQPYEYIENGAGYCIALVFRNPKTNERIFHAVGIAADQLCVVEIPGISADMFAKRAEDSAA